MWSDLPDLAQAISEQVPQPHAANILGMGVRLDHSVEAVRLDYFPGLRDTMVLSPRYATPDVVVHEYGHLWAEDKFPGGLYPPGWVYSYEDITGQPYFGAGNRPLAEGWAEAVSRMLLHDGRPYPLPSGAREETARWLGTARTGAPEKQEVINRLIVVLLLFLFGLWAIGFLRR